MCARSSRTAHKWLNDVAVVAKHPEAPRRRSAAAPADTQLLPSLPLAKTRSSIGCREQPVARFWKDEGGRANVLRFTVAVPDGVTLPQPLPLQAVLRYEDGSVVEDQEDILNLTTHPAALVLKPSAPELTIEFRIEKVSRKRGDRNFCLLVEPVYPPAFSSSSDGSLAAAVAAAVSQSQAAAPPLPVRLRGAMSKRVKGERPGLGHASGACASGSSATGADAASGSSGSALPGAGDFSSSAAADSMSASELRASLASMRATLTEVKALADGSNAVLLKLLAAPVSGLLTGSTSARSASAHTAGQPHMDVLPSQAYSSLPHMSFATNMADLLGTGSGGLEPCSTAVARALDAQDDATGGAGAADVQARASRMVSSMRTRSSSDLSTRSLTLSSSSSSCWSSSSSSSFEVSSGASRASLTTLRTGAGLPRRQQLGVGDCVPLHLPGGLTCAVGHSALTSSGNAVASGRDVCAPGPPAPYTARLRGGGPVASLPVLAGEAGHRAAPLLDQDDPDFFGLAPQPASRALSDSATAVLTAAGSARHSRAATVGDASTAAAPAAKRARTSSGSGSSMHMMACSTE